MPEQVKGSALEVGLLRGRHSRHDFHILGGLFFHDVHGIVEGHDAHHPVLAVHHGQGQEVVLAEHPGHFLLIGLGGDADQVGDHQVFDFILVVLRQQQILHCNQTDEGPVRGGDVAGIDGLLVHTLPPDAQDGLAHAHAGPQGDILRGHNGTGGVFGVAQNLVDGVAHFRVCVGQNPLDHVGGHFLHKIRRVVHVQFVQNFLKFVIGKAADQKLLRLRLHLHEGFRRQLLWKQTIHQRNLLFLQTVEQSRHVAGIHGDENVPQGGVLFVLQHGEDRFFYNFKTLSHDFPPIIFESIRGNPTRSKQSGPSRSPSYFDRVYCHCRRHPWWSLLLHIVIIILPALVENVNLDGRFFPA